MPQFRKKPVVIEARCFREYMGSDDFHALAKWCGGSFVKHLQSNGYDCAAIQIQTLEGDHLALPGDWIIKGVAGEFYPCKPDIFVATYEPAD